ncbi:MAG: HigA family addiction module antidote protein [Verrucomicrobia bacterium]|nr:HigA family addiction module antidote protein [Verrucomicrobiota bacterium]
MFDWTDYGSTAPLAPRLREGISRYRGKRNVSPEMALRLARYTGTSPDLWLGLQVEYDLRTAERKMSARILREVKPHPTLQHAMA